MDRRRRFSFGEGHGQGTGEDPLAKGGQRRAVYNDARRKVERALAAQDAAEALAAAAQQVLTTVDAEPSNRTALDALRAALARYRALGGD